MVNNLKEFRVAMVNAGFENRMSGSVYEFYKDGEPIMELRQRDRKEYGVEFYESCYDSEWNKHWKRISLEDLNYFFKHSAIGQTEGEQ